MTDEVEAHELTGRDRDRWFDEVTRMYPGFAIYQRRASNRGVPVLRLDRSGRSIRES